MEKKNNETITIPGFTLPQVEQMIKTTEKDISTGIETLESKRKPLEEAKLMYDMAKSEFDEIYGNLENSKHILANLVLLRNGTSAKDIKSTKIRVLRQTSNLDKPPKISGRGKNIKWQEMVTATLTKLNRFVKADDLYQQLINDNPDLKAPKPKMINSVQKLIQRTKARNSTEGITYYKDKYGLLSWTSDGNVPLPEYMNSFMHKD